MPQSLIDRLAQPDMQGLSDWEAAIKLNAPDSSLPLIVEWQSTEVGPGSIMDALGPLDGAILLDTIKSSTDPVMRWGLQVVETGKLTTQQRDALFSLSKTERHPSWVEVNETSVDARSVGIARGGKP
jgi:hypothetical protein